MLARGALLLLWVAFVHLTGIYLFTRGFLLSRLSLTETSECRTHGCMSATHSKAIVLIIDALRFDFISPNTPQPPSKFHHNVLSLPAEITSLHPKHSFIFNAYADPPTTTLQRIKALTTGSLPTFVDLGSNFGGASILEDSLIKQLQAAHKRIAFMGDDTWETVFPNAFNVSYPSDSFNVEDLHSVDNEVIKNLFPLLKSGDYDFLIGHFLGVDHVGHRVGPDHPSMHAKLTQMNEVLARVVQELDEDTLLVVLGDHGMDRSGDHGGDGDLETSAGMWVYSKGHALSEASVPMGLQKSATFPGAPVSHRSIQQIDLVPSISLLLGLPIPFNNLGTVIPDLFARGSELAKALELNGEQIRQYLDTYRASSSGGELDESWNSLAVSWEATKEGSLLVLEAYTRLALSACRTMWAQFNVVLMASGLSLLAMGLVSTAAIYNRLSLVKDADEWLGENLPKSLRAMAAGSVTGGLAFVAFKETEFMQGIVPLDCILFGVPFASAMFFFAQAKPKIFSSVKSIPIPLAMHTVAFFSNSFTFWEDRLVPFLLVSSLVPSVLVGFAAPTARLRKRIIGFSAVFAVCVRLMAISTVCREEQQPYCHVTFFASSSLPSPPVLVLAFLLPTAFALPEIISRFLAISKSGGGAAQTFIPWILRLSLLSGSVHWILEWVDSASITTIDSMVWRSARTTFGWLGAAGVIVAGGALWYLNPVCLEVIPEQITAPGEKRQVTVLGFANAFGAPYLLFWTMVLGAVWTTVQPTGQLVLALGTIAILSHLEIVDSIADVKALQEAFASSTPSTLLDLDPATATQNGVRMRFADIVPLALLGLQMFFGTGHQATISSIQWKAGFVLNGTLQYPWSPLTVFLNCFGPILLVGIAAPLLGVWNRAPVTMTSAPGAPPPKGPGMQSRIRGDSTRAGLGVMIYYACLLLGTATSAALLRRHLMVWKVFAPRFMAAALGTIAVDVGVLMGVVFGVERVLGAIIRVFGGKK